MQIALSLNYNALWNGKYIGNIIHDSSDIYDSYLKSFIKQRRISANNKRYLITLNEYTAD